mmetsp:Transcript_22053/g.63074  ORF Transcript_22053/g.63074 Transcript_22053/m.63074 type:complete len:625 (+) Transcript_22053:141-2015(+)
MGASFCGNACGGPAAATTTTNPGELPAQDEWHQTVDPESGVSLRSASSPSRSLALRAIGRPIPINGEVAYLRRVAQCSTNLTVAKGILADAESPSISRHSHEVQRISRQPSKQWAYQRGESSSSMGGGFVVTKESVNSELLESLQQVDPLAPFRAVKFDDLKAYGRLPRSDAKIAKPFDAMASMTMNNHVFFMSHRWLRPWHSKEECERNGHVWAGEPHPDDEHRTKFNLTIYGIERVAAERKWPTSKIAVWMDYMCIDQDDMELRTAGVRSLVGYLCRCDVMMIPISTKPEFYTVHRMPLEYGDRAWTRLEALGCYVQGLLRDTKPELYFSAPGQIVHKLDYVLLPHTMPSTGVLAMESDRPVILRHETTLLDHVHESALGGSEAARGPALVAAAGAGKIEQVKELLEFLQSTGEPNSGVNTQDHSGITPLWSAARQGRLELVRYLLEERANPDLPAHSGMGPLHAAAQQGHVEVTTDLLFHGADMNAVDKQGSTPLLWAVQNWNGEVVAQLLGSDTKHLKAARKTAERLLTSEDTDDDEAAWAKEVILAIDEAIEAKEEDIADSRVFPRSQSQTERLETLVEVAFGRAVRKSLQRRSTLENMEVASSLFSPRTSTKSKYAAA